MDRATLTTGMNPHDLADLVKAYGDVTERLKASQDLLAREVCRLREQLHAKDKELERRERLAALGEMAAGVAHEIRNPLGGIGLYLALLERQLTDRPDLLETIRRIRVGVLSIENIVSDTLSFARGQEPTMDAVSLGAIVASVLVHCEPSATGKRVTVDVSSGLDAIVLGCDHRQIERALVNLVLNAVDAVDEGGTVEIRGARRADGSVSVVVSDNGGGIDEDHLHRVFNPFFTTKHTGTGLGLAIVHRIADSHGGHVKAANRPEGGSMFVLTLPDSTRDQNSQQESC